MVATIVSFAVVGGLMISPLPTMAATQTAAETAAGTQSPVCGEVVRGNVTLSANLVCSGDGLIAGDDGTTINLNGFSIEGPGAASSKIGVVVPNQDHVSIKGPGRISNFAAATLITGARGTSIDSMILENNDVAILMTGTRDTMISQNLIRGNSMGAASHSSDGTSRIESNLFNDNKLAGISLVNSAGFGIAGNNIQGGKVGIFLDANSNGNAVVANNAFNVGIGLNNGNGLPPTINNNVFKDNNCETSLPTGLCKGQ
jgi:parallel beta-helix repeat protein